MRIVRAIAATLGVVVLVALALVPPPADGARAVWFVASETVTRGASDGFGNERERDGMVNVKTEAGTDVTAWLKPDADAGPNDWAVSNPFETCVPPPCPEFAAIDDDPIHDGLNSYIAGGADNAVSKYGLRDVPAGVTVLGVGVFAWAKLNVTGSTTYSFRVEIAGQPCVTVTPILTTAFANYSTGPDLVVVCDSVTEINSALLVHDLAGCAMPACRTDVVVTASGATVLYTEDAGAEWTSTFQGVDGTTLALEYECTTTDSSPTATIRVGPAGVAPVEATATCDGTLRSSPFSSFTGQVLVAFATPAGGSPATWTFDVLRLVTEIRGRGGDDDRGALPSRTGLPAALCLVPIGALLLVLLVARRRGRRRREA